MTKRSIGPAGASIVSDDGTKIKLTGQQKKLIEKALKRMGDDAGTFMTTITEVVGKKGVGPAGQRVREMKKKTKLADLKVREKKVKALRELAEK